MLVRSQMFVLISLFAHIRIPFQFLELSEVLWSMVLTMGLKGDNAIGAVFLTAVFAFWAGSLGFQHQ